MLRVDPSRNGYTPELFSYDVVSQHIGAATRTMACAGRTFEASASQTSPMSQSVDQPANMSAYDGPILGFRILADGANSSLNEHNYVGRAQSKDGNDKPASQGFL